MECLSVFRAVLALILTQAVAQCALYVLPDDMATQRARVVQIAVSPVMLVSTVAVLVPLIATTALLENMNLMQPKLSAQTVHLAAMASKSEHPITASAAFVTKATFRVVWAPLNVRNVLVERCRGPLELRSAPIAQLVSTLRARGQRLAFPVPKGVLHKQRARSHARCAQSAASVI